MGRWKRRLWALGMGLLLCMIPLQAQEASDSDQEEEIQEMLQEQYDAAGVDELAGQAPQEALDLYEQAQQEPLTPGDVLTFSPAKLWNLCVTALKETLQQPLVSLLSILGVLLLCAFLEGLKSSLWGGSLSSIYNTVSVLCISGFILVPMVDCINRTAQAIQSCSTFLLAYVPVFTTVIASGGQPVTAGTYHLFLLAACDLVGQVASNLLLPLMGIYLALCVVGSANPGINITGAAETIRKVVSWIMGLLVTLFVGLLSVQTFVASGTDGLAVKTTKFFISNFVPVVGSALSDAYSTAQGCMKVLKASVGAYGILTAVLTFLPTLLSVLVWNATAHLGAVAAEIFDLGQISRVLKSTASAMGVLVAMIFCFALLLIVATTVVILPST